LLPSGGFFVRGLPTLALHGINSDSAGNCQLIEEESTIRMGFPPGITSSGTRNPPEEYDSARNNQLKEADSDRQDENVRKILKVVTISGSASQIQILYTAKVNFFTNLNTKTKLK
jgi:hypothetical protein